MFRKKWDGGHKKIGTVNVSRNWGGWGDGSSATRKSGRESSEVVNLLLQQDSHWLID